MMKPALTPEEWTWEDIDLTWTEFFLHDGELVQHTEDCKPMIISRRDAIAALCLHGQPFGFTREDVLQLKRTMCRCGHDAGENPTLRNLADRIEALLPPEQEAEG